MSHLPQSNFFFQDKIFLNLFMKRNIPLAHTLINPAVFLETNYGIQGTSSGSISRGGDKFN
jgi:hypothetical protein